MPLTPRRRASRATLGSTRVVWRLSRRPSARSAARRRESRPGLIVGPVRAIGVARRALRESRSSPLLFFPGTPRDHWRRSRESGKPEYSRRASHTRTALSPTGQRTPFRERSSAASIRESVGFGVRGRAKDLQMGTTLALRPRNRFRSRSKEVRRGLPGGKRPAQEEPRGLLALLASLRPPVVPRLRSRRPNARRRPKPGLERLLGREAGPVIGSARRISSPLTSPRRSRRMALQKAIPTARRATIQPRRNPARRLPPASPRQTATFTSGGAT